MGKTERTMTNKERYELLMKLLQDSNYIMGEDYYLSKRESHYKYNGEQQDSYRLTMFPADTKNWYIDGVLDVLKRGEIAGAFMKIISKHGVPCIYMSII